MMGCTVFVFIRHGELPATSNAQHKVTGSLPFPLIFTESLYSSYKHLENRTWDNEVTGLLSFIHEERGKQALYLKQKPSELERLVGIVKIQSTEASNAIEGIRTTDTRLKQLMNDKAAPRNRDEKEIVGYRDALNTVSESFDYMSLRFNYILQLHESC